MNKIQYVILALLFGALLTQGFQCTSSEMTTARVAKKNKDFEKAITNYEKELSKNPSNVEAMYELAEIYFYEAQNTRSITKLQEYVDLVIKAKSTPVDSKSRVNLKNYESIIYNAWLMSYNSGVGILQEMDKSSTSNEEKKILGEQGITTLKNAIQLQPDNPDNYSVIGSIYESMNQKKEAISSYNKYNELLSKEINLFKSKGLTIGMTPNEFTKILGKPIETYDYKQLLQPGKQDTISYYKYKIDGEPLYIFTKHNPNAKKTGIMGWRFTEDITPYSFDITPTFELANLAFDEKDYNTSLKYINEIKQLDPTNQFANRFMVQIFDAQGNPELAMKSMEKFTLEQPNNPDYKAQYGDILLRNKRYLEATAQYEAALKIRPNDNNTKKVLGSAYKNYAVELQKAEFDKLEKDAKYEINESTYLPMLNKSKAAFEDVLKDPEFANDYAIYLELADIYAATKDDAKFKQTLDKLIQLKDEIPLDNRQYYLGRMVFWLDKSNNAQQLEIFTKELEDYK